MKMLESDSLMSPESPAVVGTRADSEPPGQRYDESARPRFREAWNGMIDKKLIEWGLHPEEIADEGVDPPTREILQQCIKLASKWRDEDLPPPDSVVPDANGGVVLERCAGHFSEVLHFWDDGTIEYQRFRGAKLVERRPL